MKAHIVATKLKEQGIAVLSFSEGSEWEDGSVYITENIHVQVPTFGGGLSVGQFFPSEEAFQFHPIRRDYSKLAKDIGKCLALEN